MRDSIRRNLRIGAFTVVTTFIFGIAILTIGSRQQLFQRHTRYVTTFRNVLGLQPGAPVNLDGVTVGFVKDIELPVDPSAQRIVVNFSVKAAYTERIRQDTTASIKTMGLLGDKYLELSGGSPGAPRVLEGGRVKGEDPAELTQFVESGEDVVDNVLAISSSLRVILRRVEAGEGLLGELTVSPREGEKMVQTIHHLLGSLTELVDKVQSGQGLLGRLVNDQELADSLIANVQDTSQAVRGVADTVSADLSRDDTAYAALLRDPKGAQVMRDSLAALKTATEALAAASEELATGKGTLPRLMKDEAYADSFLDDLHGLVKAMRSVADKIDQGEGSAGAFVNDPQLYVDIENVVRGVEHSKIVSWFIRNRREKGEELAAEEAEQQAQQQPAQPAPHPAESN